MIGSLKGSRTSPEKLKPEGQRKFGEGKVSFSKDTENGVHNMICSLHRPTEVFGKWHVQVFQLRG